MQRIVQRQSERALPFGAPFDGQLHNSFTAANRQPQAQQVDTITVQAFVLNQVDSYSIDGVARTITHTAAMVDTTGIATALAADLNSDANFSGLFIATSAAAVVTVTARRPGQGWTLIGDANLVVANITANVAAEAIPFGRLVMSDGFDGANKRAMLPRQANLTAKVVEAEPVPLSGATYHADVVADGVTYHASWEHTFADQFAVLVEQGIELTARVPGVAGEEIGFQLLDPAATDQPLRVRITDNTIFVDLATDGGGFIVSTADQVIAAINAGLAAATNPATQETDNATPDIDVRIEWNSPLFGELANQVTFQMRDPGGAAALEVTRTGLHVDIQLAHNGAVITSTALEVVDAVAANADAAEILTGTLAGTGTTVVEESDVINFSGAVDGAPTDLMVEAAGTGIVPLNDMGAAENLVLPAPPMPLAADIAGGLADALTGVLTAAGVTSVTAAQVGDELVFTAAEEGHPFGYSFGSDNIDATWTIADTGLLTDDLNNLLIGVAKMSYGVELAAGNDEFSHGYLPNSAMNVSDKGLIVVPYEAAAVNQPLFVRTRAVGANTRIGGVSTTAGAGLVPINPDKFRLDQDLGNNRGVLKLSV